MMIDTQHRLQSITSFSIHTPDGTPTYVYLAFSDINGHLYHTCKHGGNIYNLTEWSQVRLAPTYPRGIAVTQRKIISDRCVVYKPMVFVWGKDGKLLMARDDKCVTWAFLSHNLGPEIVIKSLSVLGDSIVIIDETETMYYAEHVIPRIANLQTDLGARMCTTAAIDFIKYESQFGKWHYTDDTIPRLGCSDGGLIRISQTPGNQYYKTICVSKYNLHHIAAVKNCDTTTTQEQIDQNKSIPLAFVCGDNGTILYTTDLAYQDWIIFESHENDGPDPSCAGLLWYHYLPYRPKQYRHIRPFIKAGYLHLAVYTQTDIDPVLIPDQQYEIPLAAFGTEFTTKLFIDGLLYNALSFRGKQSLRCGCDGSVRYAQTGPDNEIIVRSQLTKNHLYDIQFVNYPTDIDASSLTGRPLAFVCGEHGTIMCTTDPEYRVWKDYREALFGQRYWKDYTTTFYKLDIEVTYQPWQPQLVVQIRTRDEGGNICVDSAISYPL